MKIVYCAWRFFWSNSGHFTAVFRGGGKYVASDSFNKTNRAGENDAGLFSPMPDKGTFF